MQRLSLTRPDDWHVHLRDGDALPQAVADISRYFARAIVMPNLNPPVTNLAQADAYKKRIQSALHRNKSGDNGKAQAFTPLMTLYLTDNTNADDIRDAADSDVVYAAKLYPAGATTNSDAGVSDVKRIYPALEAMQETGLPLLVHGEVTSPDIDIFDREAVFIERTLQGLSKDFPALRIVFEHITTEDAVAFVKAGPKTLAATITAHHLLYNRNDMLVGGIRPHLFCLPVLKRNRHQQTLLAAATSGNQKFFLGSDSAPHPQHLKENACGCAGCYTAHAALELYAQAFEAAAALDKLEGFASHFGPDFYGLARNSDQITLVKDAWQTPSSLSFGEHPLVPLGAGELLEWRVE